MSRLPRPCLLCGVPTAGSVCARCAPLRGSTTTARGYGHDWQQLRLAVLVRDGWQCRWCGGPADTVDHLVPLALGGARLDPENCAAACRKCNYGRTANLR